MFTKISFFGILIVLTFKACFAWKNKSFKRVVRKDRFHEARVSSNWTSKVRLTNTLFFIAGTHFFLSTAPLLSTSLPQSSEVLNNVFIQGITVDLREPLYVDGVLTTEQGGVIEGPNIRIQAKKIHYTRKFIDSKPVVRIKAEDDLIVEFGEYLFIGKQLDYDFQEKRGVLIDGKSCIDQWYFGGEKIDLEPDGSYSIHHGFITTSQNVHSEWKIATEETKVTSNLQLSSQNVRFQLSNFSFLWLPRFSLNLGTIVDQPIRYSIQGGSQGPRLSIAYNFFSWKRFKAYARLDYRTTRGFGGGVETNYLSEDHRESFETINYLARDTAPSNPHEKMRYLFQGSYHKEISESRITLDINYDKISDIDMPSDYSDRGLDVDAAGRTQLNIRKESDFWISNFLAKVRINNFQTIKQELPTLDTHIIPMELGSTGIISENRFRLSFLDFKYANNLPNVHNYSSTRIQLWDKFYRPTQIGIFTLTPEVGGLAIYEGTSPQNTPRWVGLGLFSSKLETRLHKSYESHKHVIHPYMCYEYYTSPTASPHKHYIFDIDDGWTRLNILRFGCSNNFYFKKGPFLNRYLFTNVWMNAFFKSTTIPQTIPKIYANVVWNTSETLRHTIDTAWDFEEHTIDHFNFLTEWTLSNRLAISAEYRHRSAYAWRKVDYNNFFLDAFRSIDQLHDSQLSDRRDTLLFHLFYKFRPTWSIEFQSRHGWNRSHERNYNEFEVNVRTVVRSAWNVKFSYKHQEDEDRFTFSVALGLKKPREYQQRTPSPEF